MKKPLNPCNQCSSTDHLRLGAQGGSWWVYCERCGQEGTAHHSIALAEESWNKRQEKNRE